MDETVTALLASIRAAPDDDALCLVLADRLDEVGRPWRAALVRWQVKTGKPGLIAGIRLDRDGLVEWRWAEGCPKISTALGDEEADQFPPPAEGVGLAMSRGFADAAFCPAGWWLEHGDKLMAAEALREVRLTTVPEAGSGWSEYLYAAGLSAPRYGTFRVCGREVTVPIGGGPQSLLEARWSGVKFTLPERTATGQCPVMINGGQYATLPEGWQLTQLDLPH